MSGTDRQTKSPRPNGTGGTSVPVLFSLRNVQPNIVAVGAKATASAKTDSSVATVQTPPAKIVTNTAAPTVSSEPLMSKPVATQTKSGRSYNIVVGLLVIAVCLLVIKNTQRNSSKTEIASNSNTATSVNTPFNPVVNSPVVNSPAVTPTPFKPLESNPIVLGPAPVYVPQLPSTSNALPKLELAESVASNEPASSSVNSSSAKESPTLQELNHYESQADAGSNKPAAAVPMLLSSSKPVTSSTYVPSLPNGNTGNADGSERNASTPNIALPEARTAMAPETLRSGPAASVPSNPSASVQPIELNYSTNRSNDVPSQPTLGSSPSTLGSSPSTLRSSPSTLGTSLSPSSAGTSAAESTPLVDSNRPNTTFREIQEVILRHEQNKLSNSVNAPNAIQSYGPGIPASPVSSVGTSPSTNGNAVYGNAIPSTMPNTVPNNLANTVSNNLANTVPSNIANTLPSSGVNDSNTVLSGMPYPPLPKETQSPTIRPYEQGGLVNPLGPAVGGAATTGAPNSAQMIRQPATGGGNRYVPLSSQSPTAPMPYKPMTNTGYPPGNGN